MTVIRNQRGRMDVARNRFPSTGPPVPADEETEKCVLGTLLADPEALRELAPNLDPELFYSPASKIILEGILELDADGVPRDIIILTQHLREKGQLAAAGGSCAVTELATRYDKTLAIAKHELGRLRELHGKRQLIKLGNELAAQEGSNGEEVSLVAQAAAEKLRAILETEVDRKPIIEFKTPSELKSFEPAEDAVLVGDCHIVRGNIFIIAGAPGIGKSRSTIALAVCGATGEPWFGLRVHRRFKTMIVQNENGQFRLSKEVGELDCEGLNDFVRICVPPPFGLCFDRREFRDALAKEIKSFKPAVVVIDPWNSVAKDEKARDYLETFFLIRGVIPSGDDSPALGIVAHTRKPKADERPKGRALLNNVAGSYVIGAVPRTVFVMEPASDDSQDPRVVFTCCKNNDGQEGSPTAWERRNGPFKPVHDFNWDEYNNPNRSDRAEVAAEDLAQIFENGPLAKAEAFKALQTLTEAGRSTCYNALRLDGRFADHLRETEGLLSWVPS